MMGDWTDPQACLDHTFKGQRASCLVNPRSGYETELKLEPVAPGQKKKIAVVSAPEASDLRRSVSWTSMGLCLRPV